ncbi:hypothetical protein TNCV_4906631 [Trichonephila clavipes]|uniref:Uncharacterized protein n=1 Tax=Trichonephila clavipes TaxID=2585209 RepID=A0A8X6V859_TRICX|nr:hypothetical protein TNCV_4906631 [Trichonephila clavipes]
MKRFNFHKIVSRETVLNFVCGDNGSRSEIFRRIHRHPVPYRAPVSQKEKVQWGSNPVNKKVKLKVRHVQSIMQDT